MKRDVQIKLKAVSADHCQISYTQSKGWAITEKGKDKQSSNGTYVFLKTLQQSRDHMPSDLIPLHDGMILSFVNYELRVKLVNKSMDEIKAQHKEQSDFFAARDAELAAFISNVGSGEASVPERAASPQPVQAAAPEVPAPVELEVKASAPPIEVELVAAPEISAPVEVEVKASAPPVEVEVAAAVMQAPVEEPIAEAIPEVKAESIKAESVKAEAIPEVMAEPV